MEADKIGSAMFRDHKKKCENTFAYAEDMREFK